MKLTEASLPGIWIVEPDVFGDHRGWFMETYNEQKFKTYGLSLKFVQDNQSFSKAKGTIRGLHYQLNPKAQNKLIRCTMGSIFDVAVDIRKGSPTFGQWFGLELSADNKKQLLIPKGFAHGFMTLVENVEVQYKVDEFYAPDCDRGVLWNDPSIAIEWPSNISPILSAKDKIAPLLHDAELDFA